MLPIDLWIYNYCVECVYTGVNTEQLYLITLVAIMLIARLCHIQTSKAAARWRIGEDGASSGKKSKGAVAPSLDEELRRCLATCMPSEAAEARQRKRRGENNVSHWSGEAAGEEEAGYEEAGEE